MDGISGMPHCYLKKKIIKPCYPTSPDESIYAAISNTKNTINTVNLSAGTRLKKCMVIKQIGA